MNELIQQARELCEKASIEKANGNAVDSAALSWAITQNIVHRLCDALEAAEKELIDFHHTQQVADGKTAENARLRRINENLQEQLAASQRRERAAVEDLKLALIDEALDPCHCCEYGRTNHCTHPDGPTCGETDGKNWQWRGPVAEKGEME